jgi:hypothetical protein
MKITGDIWPIKITEPDPGSIKGQHEGMVTSIEKRGKLNIKLTKDEFLMIILDADNEFTHQLREAIRDCTYQSLEAIFDYDDFDIEVTNA